MSNCFKQIENKNYCILNVIYFIPILFNGKFHLHKKKKSISGYTPAEIKFNNFEKV